MFSAREDELRELVERLTAAVSKETGVEVRPGDHWEAILSKPPIMVYRLADVGALSWRKTLTVISHELSHVLETTPFDYASWTAPPKKPVTADRLIAVVEDARAERAFSRKYPGCASLFAGMHGEGFQQMFDYKVRKGFDGLPIKWRFFLNLDRTLHGLPPWGDARDKDAVLDCWGPVQAAADAETTQGSADLLQPAYLVLVDLLRQEREEREARRAVSEAAEDVSGTADLEPPEPKPEDYVENDPFSEGDDDLDDRTGEVSDRVAEPAESDDGHPGGIDGTAGERARAEGAGDEGYGEGDAPGASEDAVRYSQQEEWHPDDWDEPAAPQLETMKPVDIVEEMVQEEAGSKNKTIEILAYRARHSSKLAAATRKQIEEERRMAWQGMAAVLGKTRISRQLRDRLEGNLVNYNRTRAHLEHEIASLRAYALSVLRDNATARYGGDYTRGQRIKKNKLHRLYLDDERIFERPELVGGKSYDVVISADQSASQKGRVQTTVFHAALIALEALDGLANTALVGFTDFELFTGEQTRTYKGTGDRLDYCRPMVAELSRSYHMTPMDEGVRAAMAELEGSKAEAKVMMLITDGRPNNPKRARLAFAEARLRGIETYALLIAKPQGWMNQETFAATPTKTLASGDAAALAFLSSAADRAAVAWGAGDVPAAFSDLLRGAVRRRRVA